MNENDPPRKSKREREYLRNEKRKEKKREIQEEQQRRVASAGSSTYANMVSNSSKSNSTPTSSRTSSSNKPQTGNITRPVLGTTIPNERTRLNNPEPKVFNTRVYTQRSNHAYTGGGSHDDKGGRSGYGCGNHVINDKKDASQINKNEPNPTPLNQVQSDTTIKNFPISGINTNLSENSEPEVEILWHRNSNFFNSRGSAESIVGKTSQNVSTTTAPNKARPGGWGSTVGSSNNTARPGGWGSTVRSSNNTARPGGWGSTVRSSNNTARPGGWGSTVGSSNSCTRGPTKNLTTSNTSMKCQLSYNRSNAASAPASSSDFLGQKSSTSTAGASWGVSTRRGQNSSTMPPTVTNQRGNVDRALPNHGSFPADFDETLWYSGNSYEPSWSTNERGNVDRALSNHGSYSADFSESLWSTGSNQGGNVDRSLPNTGIPSAYVSESLWSTNERENVDRAPPNPGVSNRSQLSYNSLNAASSAAFNSNNVYGSPASSSDFLGHKSSTSSAGASWVVPSGLGQNSSTIPQTVTNQRGNVDRALPIHGSFPDFDETLWNSTNWTLPNPTTPTANTDKPPVSTEGHRSIIVSSEYEAQRNNTAPRSTEGQQQPVYVQQYSNIDRNSGMHSRTMPTTTIGEIPFQAMPPTFAGVSTAPNSFGHMTNHYDEALIALGYEGIVEIKRLWICSQDMSTIDILIRVLVKISTQDFTGNRPSEWIVRNANAFSAGTQFTSDGIAGLSQIVDGNQFDNIRVTLVRIIIQRAIAIAQNRHAEPSQMSIAAATSTDNRLGCRQENAPANHGRGPVGQPMQRNKNGSQRLPLYIKEFAPQNETAFSTNILNNIPVYLFEPMLMNVFRNCFTVSVNVFIEKLLTEAIKEVPFDAGDQHIQFALISTKGVNILFGQAITQYYIDARQFLHDVKYLLISLADYLRTYPDHSNLMCHVFFLQSIYRLTIHDLRLCDRHQERLLQRTPQSNYLYFHANALAETLFRNEINGRTDNLHWSNQQLNPNFRPGNLLWPAMRGGHDTQNQRQGEAAPASFHQQNAQQQCRPQNQHQGGAAPTSFNQQNAQQLCRPQNQHQGEAAPSSFNQRNAQQQFRPQGQPRGPQYNTAQPFVQSHQMYSNRGTGGRGHANVNAARAPPPPPPVPPRAYRRQ